MPAPTTTDELLELIGKSGLVPAERLAEALGGAGPAEGPRELAERLVDSGLVTRFQAEQFLLGKWRGFTIGKYRVLERLGSGGMGTVYLCEHMMVGRRVAIKVLPNNLAANPSTLARFYREARASGVLDHPNLVKAHDVDQDGKLHFLVMDYFDGANLQSVVNRCGPLSVARACHYVRLAAQGLHHAHQASLVHRDIKPANLLLERKGNVRVLDMGLARFLNDHTDLLTLKYDDQSVLGTADYVSPEQAQNSHDVDIRTDVYSLGATFYFLLTGRPPFPEGKVGQKLIWHQVRQPNPVRAIRPEVPEGVCAVVVKMMAKDRSRRYQTPAEVIAALAPWAADPVPPPTEEEIPRLSPAATAPSDSGQRTPARVARAPGTWAPAATAVLDRGPAHVAAGAPETPRPSSTPTPSAPAEAPLFAVSLRTEAPLAPAPRPAPAPARAPAAPRQALPVLSILLSGVGIGLALSWMIRTAGLVAAAARLFGP